ncbi:MAG: histidine ammonia-lyase [Anaerolineales bacterium]
MIHLNGESLKLEDVVAVARGGARVAPLEETVRERMRASQLWIDESIHHKGAVIYGVNTGFGRLATTRIDDDQARKLSRNLILTCVSGVGPPLSAEMVRAMMLIRANTLARGNSGARPVIAETLLTMLDREVTPYVPAKGSVGASGDLTPMAHIAVVMTRDLEEGDGGYSGQAWYRGELLSGAEAMVQAGIDRLILEVKEGLALTNGTNMMSAAGALAVHDAEKLVRHAEIAAALSLEALLAQSSSFHPALHEANSQPGQVHTAANIMRLVDGSLLIDSSPERVQDAYSLRCIPQVIGPVRDILAFLRERFTCAINASSDNPLIFLNLEGEGARAISGGNFHGQGPAMWLDFLGIAITALGSIAERRVFRLTTPELSDGLPSMLVKSSGLDSGLMMPQYTAAALVSDNKTLAHPDSVDSIPSSGNQEDHVSMGANAARHTLEIVDNVRHIIAIELLSATQGIDLRPDGPQRQGRGTAAAYASLRRCVAFLEHDRETSSDIEALAKLIHSEVLLEEVSLALGEEFM